MNSPMTEVRAFEALAVSTGLALPPLLRQLISAGRTSYGPDWASTYETRRLSDPPALLSAYDFEWIDADEARDVTSAWLNPAAQDGRSFLPFAQSGAGDSYALTQRASGEVGVALIWHDEETSQVSYASFNDFVCTKYLETFADLSHLQDNASREIIAQMVQADVAGVAALLPNALGSYLQGLSVRSLFSVHPEPKPLAKNPKRPKERIALLSSAELAIELARFFTPHDPPFRVTARWDVKS